MSDSGVTDINDYSTLTAGDTSHRHKRIVEIIILQDKDYLLFTSRLDALGEKA